MLCKTVLSPITTNIYNGWSHQSYNTLFNTCEVEGIFNTHTHTHTPTHACTHTHVHTHACTHARRQAGTHTHARTRTHARVHTHAYTRTHTHIRRRTHACTHAPTYTRTHAHTRARARTRTQMHIHIHAHNFNSPKMLTTKQTVYVDGNAMRLTTFSGRKEAITKGGQMICIMGFYRLLLSLNLQGTPTTLENFVRYPDILLRWLPSNQAKILNMQPQIFILQ